MKFKNIFITGSTGVVGKPIFLKLINQGHNVFALSRNTKNEDFIRTNKAEVVNGDLFSENIYSQLKDKSIDAIFHVAGANQKCQKDPSSMHKTNIEGTKKILELGNNLQIKKFIYTSSAVTLGEQKILTLNDFADLASDELTGGYDVVKGERIRIKGCLEDFALSKKEADDLIMSARDIVYQD